MPSHARERRFTPDSIRGGAFSGSSPLPSGAVAGTASKGTIDDHRRFQTRRRRLRDLLASRDDGFSLEEIQDIFDLRRNVALDHLKHLQMTLRRREGETLLMLPPRCGSCEYVFNLDHPAAPGRCPMCKSERVTLPVFKVAKGEA